MVFGIGQFNYAIHFSLRHTLVAMAIGNENLGFNTKSAITQLCAGDTPHMLAPIRGFSGSATLMVSVKLGSDDPRCHGNEKLGILPENSP